MELCTYTRCIPNQLSNLTSLNPHITNLQLKPSLLFKSNSFALNNNPGLRQHSYSCIKATTSEETSSEANQYVKEETDDVVPDNEGPSEENNGFGGFGLFKDDNAPAADEQFPQFDFLNKLKMELELEDSFSIAVLAVGGVTALWLAANVVGSIDRIPLFPKLMEVVGLGYSIWFTTRYLLFKRNRDELASKIDEIKQQVLGSKN